MYAFLLVWAVLGCKKKEEPVEGEGDVELSIFEPEHGATHPNAEAETYLNP